MIKTIFILGAGASRGAGAPLMSDFMDKASYLHDSGVLTDEEKGHFENVFRARAGLQVVHSKARLDFNNIEKLFAAFEMANVIDRFPGLANRETNLSTEELIDSLKRLIVVTLERTIRFPRAPKTKAYGRSKATGTSQVRQLHFAPPQAYNAFRRLIFKQEAAPKHDVSILSFNYDLALDYSLYYGERSSNRPTLPSGAHWPCARRS